jgi:hypothetical protein
MKILLGMIRWIAKHWAISLSVLLVAAITVVAFVLADAEKKRNQDPVPVYITLRGLGEGKDMEKREYTVENSAALSEVFSAEYKEINEEFKAVIGNNTFEMLKGVRPQGGKRFYVTIDGRVEDNITQAYIYRGADIVITYR